MKATGQLGRFRTFFSAPLCVIHSIMTHIWGRGGPFPSYQVTAFLIGHQHTLFFFDSLIRNILLIYLNLYLRNVGQHLLVQNILRYFSTLMSKGDRVGTESVLQTWVIFVWLKLVIEFFGGSYIRQLLMFKTNSSGWIGNLSIIFVEPLN